ncbi:hypothetical protein [Providencia burhodogranariea]|uniref:Uncharacterized protein n=1 Tax=Providencia burhodogranariea DSM 19968 TaxID=1141662 RepID=K8WYJ1_9GAMM|nr:hypothetical protein [Providencia burhodogranariea]EKT62442.1 hypothetical protein OOA_07640 [Providencia burhodogranariea DSM 19968]
MKKYHVIGVMVLNLILKKRLSLGVNFRSDYPDESVSLVERLNCNNIEICIKTEELVEVLSIKFKGELPKEDFFVFYTWRAIIADYAYRIWNKNKNITIPLTEDICFLTEGLEEVNSLPIGLIDIHKYMRFGDVRFTRKEIITIRMLLFHCKIKEISAFHGCSEASEHKRIQRIKQKLNCPYASSSRLFTILRTKGITLACLEGLITYR